MTERNAAGHFLAGSSGNPNGRPKVFNEFRDLCRKKSPAAFKKIVATMNGDDHALALKAAELICAYAWGKPPQSLCGEGGEGAAVVVIKKFVHAAGD